MKRTIIAGSTNGAALRWVQVELPAEAWPGVIYPRRATAAGRRLQDVICTTAATAKPTAAATTASVERRVRVATTYAPAGAAGDKNRSADTAADAAGSAAARRSASCGAVTCASGAARDLHELA